MNEANNWTVQISLGPDTDVDTIQKTFGGLVGYVVTINGMDESPCRIIDVANTEDPDDVFLCFDVLDPDGNMTDDLTVRDAMPWSDVRSILVG